MKAAIPYAITNNQLDLFYSILINRVKAYKIKELISNMYQEVDYNKLNLMLSPFN